MRRFWWAALVALLLVVGCTKKDADSGGTGQGGPAASADAGAQPAPAEDNEIIEEFALGADTITYNGELPPDWPGRIQLYPDGTLGETTMSDTPQGKVFSAKMMAAAPPEKVADFYHKQFAAENTHISEITRSPKIANETYSCKDYVITVMAEQVEDGTKITFLINPPAPADQVLPAIRQYVDLDMVPEGFPEDLIPRYPGSRIVNGFSDGLGFHSAEMVTTDDLATAADYYRERFTALGWEEQKPIEKDIVRAYSYKKEGEKLTLNVSAGGDGENHISISYTTRP